MKKVMSMNYGSSTSSWKPWRWMRLNLVLSMGDIYINSNLNPLTKFTSSSRSTTLKDILPWNITKTTRIVISNSMKQGIPIWRWWKVNGKWYNNMIKITQYREQILAWEEINKSKRAGLWESQPGIRVGNWTIWVRSFEIEKLWQSSPDLSVPSEASPHDGH